MHVLIYLHVQGHACQAEQLLPQIHHLARCMTTEENMFKSFALLASCPSTAAFEQQQVQKFRVLQMSCCCIVTGGHRACCCYSLQPTQQPVTCVVVDGAPTVYCRQLGQKQAQLQRNMHVASSAAGCDDV